MRRHRQALGFGLGFLTAACIAAALFVWHQRGAQPWPELAEATRIGSDPVLVIIAGDAQRVARVRAAIGAKRIAAETDAAFAVKERRIVAASFAAVGPVVMAAGWSEEPLEIVSLRRRAAETDDDSTDDLAALMQKPSLNLLEAQRVLGLF
jgi:hypothetical protein